MAKYIDSNGLSHVFTLLKGYFSKIGHTHTVSVTTGDSVSVTAGTAASLSTTTHTIPNVTSVGTTPTLGTPIVAVRNVTTNVYPEVDDGVLSFSTVTTVEPVNIPNVTSVGTTPTLGTAFSVKGVDAFTANTPTAVTKKTVVTSVGGTTGASTN